MNNSQIRYHQALGCVNSSSMSSNWLYYCQGKKFIKRKLISNKEPCSHSQSQPSLVDGGLEH